MLQYHHHVFRSVELHTMQFQWCQLRRAGQQGSHQAPIISIISRSDFRSYSNARRYGTAGTVWWTATGSSVSTVTREWSPRRLHWTASNGPSTCWLSWQQTGVWYGSQARLKYAYEWKTWMITHRSFNNALTSRRFVTASYQVAMLSFSCSLAPAVA